MENENQTQEQSQETTKIVPLSTKIKIVAALFVVGVSTYAAYWVQEPTQLRTDVVSPSSAQSSSNESDQNQASQSVTKEISIADFSFNPQELEIEKGTTVVWVNKDNVPHSVVGDSFTSGTLDPGQSFSFTFTEEGNFEYYCSFHPQMKGTVKVGALLATQTETSDQPQVSGETSSSNDLQNTVAETELHSAADTLSDDTSMSGEESSQNTTSQPLTTSTDTENQLIAAATENQNSLESPKSLESAEDEKAEPGKIANSGPEDYLYFFVFGAILYFNRKKLFKVKAN